MKPNQFKITIYKENDAYNSKCCNYIACVLTYYHTKIEK